MDVLRSASSPLTAKEVHNRLERELAYTTVMTLRDWLYRKQPVERQKIRLAFLYSPTFASQPIHHLLEDLLGMRSGWAWGLPLFRSDDTTGCHEFPGRTNVQNTHASIPIGAFQDRIALCRFAVDWSDA